MLSLSIILRLDVILIQLWEDHFINSIREILDLAIHKGN